MCDEPKQFTLKLRLPWWVQKEAQIFVNGVSETAEVKDSFATLRRVWHDDTIRLTLPTSLVAEPLPDAPETVAFMDGPLVLAGLTDEERTLNGNFNNLKTLLRPDEERHHVTESVD